MSQPLVLGVLAKQTDWPAIAAWAAWATVGSTSCWAALHGGKFSRRASSGAGLPPKGIPELVTEVENIRKEINKWTAGDDHGLLVHTLDERRKERLSMRRINVRILRQQGLKGLARWLWGRALSRYGVR
jgi:hypothetical protein